MPGSGDECFSNLRPRRTPANLHLQQPLTLSAQAMSRGPKLWLALLLLLIAASLAGAMDCKDILKRSFMYGCGGIRNKRSATLADGLDPAADFPSMIEKKQVRKRQIMSIREIIVSSRVPIYNSPYPSAPSYERAPIVPPSEADLYQTYQRFESLPQENGSNVGYQINEHEIIEVFNEIYARLRRSSSGKSKDQELSEFIPKAYECCKDPQHCPEKASTFNICPV